MDILSPSSVDLTHKDYVIIDNTFISYLYITGYGYSTNVGIGWLNSLVEAGEGISISYTISRQPKEKTLSKISQSTMINRTRMREVGDTRSDFEELDSAISSGLFLKEGMNRQGEEFYYIHTIIEVIADDVDTLEQRVSLVQNMCVSQDMFCKRADYKHGEGFTSFLPLLQMDADIERKSRRNALTTSVAAAFPFSSFEMCDQNGIFLGINKHNKSACIIDIFDNAQYSNSNLCIMGMSGAGKTFLLQLIAKRLREQKIQVVIIAPWKGHEFRPACEAIGGKYIKLAPSSLDCISPMEIRRRTLDTDHELGSSREDSLLADKIQKLHIYYSLGKPNMTEEEKQYLDTALLECYGQFGITHNNDSVFQEKERITFKEMPVQKDLYNILMQKPETKNLALSVSRHVTGSAKNLGGQTNVELDNLYTVLDISEMPKDLLAQATFTALDFCDDKAKESRIRKIAIIIDELWGLIGAGSNVQAAEFVIEWIKTIRAYGGAAITATQDLNDFFALENGKYGKAVINNSRLKVVLPLEEDEARAVQKVMNLSNEETIQITRNHRGEGLFCAGRNRISVAFHATNVEKNLITTDREELMQKFNTMKG